MPEWLIERGIGETRTVLAEGDTIREARVLLDGNVRAGSVVRGRLVSRGANGRNAVAKGGHGTEFLLPRGSGRTPEGEAIVIEVMREAFPGSEPWKRPLARLTDEAPALAPDMQGRTLSFPSPVDELARLGWPDLMEEARSGVVRFDGGELRISPTPAMTLIDVDGFLDSKELARRGARAAAEAIRRLDIGGSIGIDLPTSGSKAARLDAAEAIDAALPDPFERTAVNGFGFVQIVRPRVRPSLVELAADRPSFEARALLRQVALGDPGPCRVVANPAVIALLERCPSWLQQLGGQIGGAVELRSDPSIPICGGYAERL